MSTRYTLGAPSKLLACLRCLSYSPTNALLILLYNLLISTTDCFLQTPSTSITRTPSNPSSSKEFPSRLAVHHMVRCSISCARHHFTELDTTTWMQPPHCDLQPNLSKRHRTRHAATLLTPSCITFFSDLLSYWLLISCTTDPMIYLLIKLQLLIY